MSHEILYTSAPRLLKPGMTGYGTVVSTRGISSPLADKLESLSGYRWAFEQGDPQARLNPVCHSHVVITVAGQKYHVLSRVADYGADYSGRSNKIAHHVALSESELTPGGPGWVLKSPGFCETRWDEQLKVIDAGRQPTRAVRDSADYSAWKRVTGDAGWAGGLAETVGSTDRRAVHVIFPLGTDTLGLVEESLNLLPHRDRWNVSFSTYYNVLPASVDCHWRFVLDGTPEANNLRRQPHQRIIDLCRPLGPAIGGELVQRARDGWQPAFGPPSHVPAKSPVQPQSVAAVSQPSRGAPAASPNRVDADVSEPTGLVYVPPVPSRYAASNSEPRQSVPSGWRLPLWGTLLLCLLIGSGAGGAGFWLGRRSATQKAPKEVTEKSPSATTAEQATKVDDVRKDSGRLNSEVKPPMSPVVDDTSGSPAEEVPQSLSRTTNSDHTSNEPAKSSPLVESEAPKKTDSGNSVESQGEPMKVSEPQQSNATPDEYLSLPSHDIASYTEENNRAIYDIHVTSLKPDIFGAPVFLGKERTFAPPNLDEKNQVWRLLGSDEKKLLATLESKDGKLIFQWDRSADAADVSVLRRCLIRLEPGGKPILMSKPFEINDGCLLPDIKASQFSLCPTESISPELDGLEHCLPKLSLGGWRLNGLPPEYEIKGTESILSPTAKQKLVELKISKDQIDIAELEVSFRPKDPKDKESPLSNVEIKLMALIPAIDGKDIAPKLWTAKTRSDDNNEFSIASVVKKMMENDDKKKREEAWISFAESAWGTDGKVTEKGAKEIPDLISKKSLDPMLTRDTANDLNSAELQYRNYGITTRKESIQSCVKQNEKLNELKFWRVGMDELTTLFETKVTFSFDAFYEAKIVDKDVPVILGIVTTKLPSAKNGQPTTPATSSTEDK